MINKNEIIFLVRTYNEGEHVLKVIEEIKAALFNKILVIDDGSTDGTYEKLSQRKDIIYLRHLINRGGGAALETGFEFIRRNYEKLGVKYVVTFDADGQHDINDIDKFIEAMEKQHPDVIIGSRFLENTYENMPFTRKLILWGGKFFTFFISNIKISDPHNGYRMFTIEAIKKIKLTMDGFEYASELIDKIAQNKLKFMEVPVNIRYTPYSLSKGQKNSNALKIALRMIYEKFIK